MISIIPNRAPVMQEVLYCPQCAHRLHQAIPDGDHAERSVCSQCDYIHYLNPKLVAGCIVEYQEKILLCRRAIEPRHGFWTVPAGYMENGETTAQCAAREAYEEAEARVDDLVLFASYSLPHISQVYLLYRGTLRDGAHAAGSESLETRLLHAEDIPWQDLAFFVVADALQRYLQDRQRGHFAHYDAVVEHDAQHQARLVSYSRVG